MKKIILSDVDGTITRGSLVLDHATSLHNSGVVNLGGSVANWNTDKKNEHHISSLAEAYREAIVGMTVADMMVEQFISRQIEENNFYETLGRLISATAAGTDVMLISGSPSYLVSEFASRFGFDGVGTEYFTCEQGRITGEISPMFHAQAKAAKLASMNIRSVYTEVHAYGDTASDEPLFDVADYSVLVQPTAETMALLGHKVHELIH